MRKLLVFIGLSLSILSCRAQYGNNNYRNDNDVSNRYFYEEEFDWRWDVRVRISQGINNGFLTRREANRLYDRLEQIERKEFAFQSDGYLSGYEQNEIWDDVVFLNSQLGLELRDFDRTYYGYSLLGAAVSGYMPWYFGNSYDFNRFDRRGFGSIQLGYRPRNFFPRNHFYYHNNRNYSNNRNWGNYRNSASNRNWDNNRSNDRENSRNSDWNRRYNGNSRENGNSNKSNRTNGDRNNQNDNDRSGKNRNDVGSRDERFGERNASKNEWNRESSNERANENAKIDKGRESSKQNRAQNGRNNSRSKEEILTPPSANPRERSENKSERPALPERKKANDSNRRGEN